MAWIFALSWLVLLAWPVSGASTIEYCSNVNTGSDNDPKTDTFQSVGLCTKTCTGKYAFGIVQGSSCWCSNVAPNEATNVDTSKCDDSCPGYPDDTCGSESEGLFGYIMMMNIKASSTATAPSTASTGSLTDTTSTSDYTATGGVSVNTVGGQVQTVTVSNAGVTAAADTATSSSKDSSSGLSTGAVAGVAVGSVAGFGAILALLFIYICTKRRQRAQNTDPNSPNFMHDGRHSKGSQMSFVKGMFSDSHSHTLSAGSSNTARMPHFTDDRMKPDTILYPNGARDSSVSLQDNEDYSRPVLRVSLDNMII